MQAEDPDFPALRHIGATGSKREEGKKKQKHELGSCSAGFENCSLSLSVSKGARFCVFSRHHRHSILSFVVQGLSKCRPVLPEAQPILRRDSLPPPSGSTYITSKEDEGLVLRPVAHTHRASM